MKKIFIALILATISLLASAQDKESALTGYIEKANTLCPIQYGDGWTVESFTCENDTVVTTITVHGEAANYLPMIAANADAVKRMWLGQMMKYGENWNRLIEMVVAEKLTFQVNLQSDDKSTTITFVFTTDELSRAQL